MNSTCLLAFLLSLLAYTRSTIVFLHGLPHWNLEVITLNTTSIDTFPHWRRFVEDEECEMELNPSLECGRGRSAILSIQRVFDVSRWALPNSFPCLDEHQWIARSLFILVIRKSLKSLFDAICALIFLFDCFSNFPLAITSSRRISPKEEEETQCDKFNISSA